MTNLIFDFEWLDPGEAKGEELRATWAKLEIRLDNDTISCLIDHRNRSVRSSMFLPLYPLAEWLTTHWWFLFHEIETSGRSTPYNYEKRHNLRYGAEGFSLPSLLIQPSGEQIRLEWSGAHLCAQSIEFTARGSAHIAASQLRQNLSDFIFAVLRRLHDEGIENSLLEQEWDSIQAVGSQELDFCVAAATLGLDPYALTDTEQESIITAGELLPAILLNDFFAVAEANKLVAQAWQVNDALELSHQNGANLEPIKSLRADLASLKVLQGPPWNEGYQFARDLRRRLNLNGTKLDSYLSLGQALGVTTADLQKAIIEIANLPRSLDALVATNSFDSPGFAVRERRGEDAIRFSFCRGLFEYFTTPVGEPLLVTRARSERQKRNRAFAAEFLVPAELLRDALPGQTIGDEEMDDLAATFGVSSSVIRHQIENHHLGKIATRPT